MEKVQTLVKTRPEASARALILFAAFVSFVISVVLWFDGHRQEGIFVGHLGAVDPVTRSNRASARRAMSTPALFVVGVLVTLIVVAALALLMYAAVLDGREDAARRGAPELPRIPETDRDELIVA